jgi:hypothetical protein
MRSWWCAVVLACVASGVAWGEAGTLAAADDPAAGSVANGAYWNAYFGLRYAPPQGWVEGDEGPGPSETGYYVLGSFVPKGATTATVLIAAQDMFFAARPFSDAAAMAGAFSRAIAATAGMTVDRGPSAREIAGHRFMRIDFSGVGLYRAMFLSEIRCHMLSVNLATNDPALLADMAQSVDALTLSAATDIAATPICVKDYASAETLLHRIEPVAVAPRFERIPVRIVIGADGLIAHIHVIRAAPEQREAIENALVQWRFKPDSTTGEARAVETGLLFEFRAAQSGRIERGVSQRSAAPRPQPD